MSFIRPYARSLEEFEQAPVQPAPKRSKVRWWETSAALLEKRDREQREFEARQASIQTNLTDLFASLDRTREWIAETENRNG